MNNLLDPAILFFVFGVLAGAARSNLKEMPPPITSIWKRIFLTMMRSDSILQWH